MINSNLLCAIIFIVSAFVQCAHNLDYSDLETLGVECANLEQRYKCIGYRSALVPLERGCECDAGCNTYGDCCINAPRRRTSGRSSTGNRQTCLQVGDISERGVLAISTCQDNWIGSSQVRQKCEGPDDFSDPLIAAPVMSVSQSITYRNRYCAQCNDADMENLKTYIMKLECLGLDDFLTDEQIYADMKYNSELGVWGIDRWNTSSNSTYFKTCDLIFDVPSYFNNSVRFCKANVISQCPPGFTRHLIKKACEEYMAVVYYSNISYKNPHCAICNGIRINQLKCDGSSILSRKRPMSFALLLDVNMSDGDQVGMTRVATPQCPSNHKYDPFFKKCRKLVCALPRHVVVDGKCVRQAA